MGSQRGISIQDDEGVWRGIMPFITSYRTECHRKVDVTHVRPHMTGKRKIRIAAGTTFYKNRGYMMSVSLDFHHGTPKLEPHALVPLWHGLGQGPPSRASTDRRSVSKQSLRGPRGGPLILGAYSPHL